MSIRTDGRFLAALVTPEGHVVRDQDQAKGSAPRRPGGPPRMVASAMRSRRLNLDVSAIELATLTERATAARVSLRFYVRETALGNLSGPKQARSSIQPIPSAADFDAAATLTRIAGDLAHLAEAAAAGIVTGVAPDLLRDLCDAAHLLGLRLIGAAPRAR